MSTATRSKAASGAYSGPYASLVNRAARANGLDPFWLAAVLFVENRFKPTGASPVGAEGIAQIYLDAHPEVTKAQADSPAFAIPWAARELASLRRRANGNLALATKWYNTGANAKPDVVAGAGTAYLDQVKAAFAELRKSVRVIGGGFLRAGATYIPGRTDQGQDFQTDPGAPIIAPGNGRVLAVKSDPGGFGPSYPVVTFTSGPYAGQEPIYIGHTLAALKPGATFRAGDVLSHTGQTPIGNASKPGWAEIGYAPNGSPGAFGQAIPGGKSRWSAAGELVSGVFGLDPHKVGEGAVGLVGGSGAVSAVNGFDQLVAPLGKFLSKPGDAFLWLLFMLLGFALLYVGLTRLFGVRPASAIAGAVAP